MEPSKTLPTPPDDIDFIIETYENLYPCLEESAFLFLKNDDFLVKKYELCGPRITLEEHFESIASDIIAFTKQELCQSLFDLGFKKEFTDKVLKDGFDDVIPHWTVAHWAVHFLHIAERELSDRQDKTLYASLFELDPSSSTSPQNPSNTHVVNYVTISMDEFTSENIKTKVSKLQSGDFKLLYHFSTTEAVDRIINEGIDKAYCKLCSEFAVNGAFYLLEDPQFGIRWISHKARSSQISFIVYKVPVREYESLVRYRFNAADDKWKQYCHYNYHNQRATRIELAHDMVIGPVCKFRTRREQSYQILESYIDGSASTHFQHACLSLNSFALLNSCDKFVYNVAQ